MSNEGDGGPATLAEFSEVEGLAVDSNGYVYFGTRAGFLRVIDPGGTIHGIGGQEWPEGVRPPWPGTEVRTAGFTGIADLAVDADDNLYLSAWGDLTLLAVSAPVEPESTVSWILHERLEALSGERLGGGNPLRTPAIRDALGIRSTRPAANIRRRRRTSRSQGAVRRSRSNAVTAPIPQ
jgi:hypothetical protein